MPRKKNKQQKHTTDIRPCPACRGKGAVTQNYRDFEPEYEEQSTGPKLETCNECGGSGEIQFH